MERDGITERDKRQRHIQVHSHCHGRSGGRAVRGIASDLQTRVPGRVPVVSQGQQDSLLGRGPTTCRVRLGNKDLGGLIRGPDNGE